MHYATALMEDSKVDKEKILFEMNDLLKSLSDYLKHNPITLDLDQQNIIKKNIEYINKTEDITTYDLLNSIYNRIVFTSL